MTAHEKIFVVIEDMPIGSQELQWGVQKLIQAAQAGEVDKVRGLIQAVAPECRLEPVRAEREAKERGEWESQGWGRCLEGEIKGEWKTERRRERPSHYSPILHFPMTRRLARWISDGEILIAPLVALLLIFPTRAPLLTSVGLIALTGTWLVRWGAQGHPWRCTPLNLALLFLLATVPVAVWASAVRDLTTEALAYLLAGVVLFSAVVHWIRAAGQAWWVWCGLVAVGSILAVLAPLGMHISVSKLFPLPSVYTR